MNNANSQLKLRSEAGFPMKSFITSPLYSSEQWVEVLNCLLDLESEKWQVRMMLDMNSKRKWIKNTSVSNTSRVKQERKTITNTNNLFRGSSTSSTSPPSPREEFHYPLRIFSQRSLHKEMIRSTQDWSTQLQLSILYTIGNTKSMRFTSSWWP